MPRSVFTQLRARVEDGAVRLTFYLTTPVFESTRGRGKPLAIRIHRKAERRFTFGRNSESYFDGLDATKARVIFEGPLPAVNERKFEYVDRSARLGGTYAYWVSPARAGRPTGPAPVRVRDTQVWWPHAVVEERLTTLAEAYPGLVSLKRYGQTVHGRPIRGAVAGNAENVMASVGTIHAGESGPELLIPALGWLLQEDRGLLQDVGFAVLPSVNIDERERLIQGYPGYLRVNARGVDLNRNFDADWGEVDYGYGLITSDPDSVTYRGPRPSSEPETRAVVKFLRHVQPRAVFSYHALASITGARFLAPCAGEGDRTFVAECTARASEFTRGFYPRRKKARLTFDATPGSLPAYVYSRFGVPAFDLEWDGNPDAKPSLTDRTTRELLATYQQRHYGGTVAVLSSLAGRC